MSYSSHAMSYSSHVILILLLFVSLAATKDGVSATCGELPIRVEWIIPVGCDCSGFLLEFLGVAAALRDALRARGACARLRVGPCGADMLERVLFAEEAAAVRALHADLDGAVACPDDLDDDDGDDGRRARGA